MMRDLYASHTNHRSDGWNVLSYGVLVCMLLAAVGIAPAHRPALANDRDVADEQQSVLEHHHQPSSSYSLFMHHAAGAGVLAIALLILADRVTAYRYRWIRLAQASAWIAVGIFLFIWADPEGWPMGTITLMDSFRMPTAAEWAQHKFLSLIPMVLGLQAAFRPSAQPRPRRNLGLAALAIIGVVGLLSHQHQNHPGADIVNLQHAGFAFTAMVIALSLLMEVVPSGPTIFKRFLFPSALAVLGLQLVLYIE